MGVRVSGAQGAEVNAPAGTVAQPGINFGLAGEPDVGFRVNAGNIEFVLDGVVIAILTDVANQGLTLGAAISSPAHDIHARQFFNNLDDYISGGGAGMLEVVAAAGRDVLISPTTAGRSVINAVGGTYSITNVQTTDATVTTCGQKTPSQDGIVKVRVRVFGLRSTLAEGAGYVLEATFRRNGGVVAQVGATTAVATHEDVAAWNATLDTDGTNIRCRVTGAAGVTINWDAYWEYVFEN